MVVIKDCCVDPGADRALAQGATIASSRFSARLNDYLAAHNDELKGYDALVRKLVKARIAENAD